MATYTFGELVRAFRRVRGKVEALREHFPQIVLHQAEDPNRSHQYIESYAGEDVWVFGVDGDEIYDPEGLSRLRPRILAGEFDAWWRVAGHMLHATPPGPGWGTWNRIRHPSYPKRDQALQLQCPEVLAEPRTAPRT